MEYNVLILFNAILTPIIFVKAEEKVLLLSENGHLFYQKTFHMSVKYKLGGRLNFQPNLYAKGDNAHLTISPNFEDGTYKVRLTSEDDSAENCNLSYHTEDAYDTPGFTQVNATFSEKCTWPGHKLKPGHWYRFAVQSAGKSLINQWQMIEPAFDPDALGISVLPDESSIGVRLDRRKAGHVWNDLIGQEGEILVNLLDEEKITPRSIKAWTSQHMNQPSTLFKNVAPGRCYTVEVMSASRNVLSYNRTWFHVRPLPLSFSLLFESASKDSVQLTLQPAPQDASCTSILIVREADVGQSMPRYVFPGSGARISIDGLKPGRRYVIGGVSQCGSLADLCRLQKTAIQSMNFETKTNGN